MGKYFLLGFLCWLGVSIIYHFIFEPEYWEGKPKGKEERRQKNMKSLGNFLYYNLYIAGFLFFMGSFVYGLRLILGIYASVCNIFYASTECIRPNSGMKLISLEEGFYYLGLSILFGVLTWLGTKGIQKADNLRETSGSNLMSAQRRRVIKKFGFSDDFIDKFF